MLGLESLDALHRYDPPARQVGATSGRFRDPSKPTSRCAGVSNRLHMLRAHIFTLHHSKRSHLECCYRRCLYQTNADGCLCDAAGGQELKAALETVPELRDAVGEEAVVAFVEAMEAGGDMTPTFKAAFTKLMTCDAALVAESVGSLVRARSVCGFGAPMLVFIVSGVDREDCECLVLLAKP